MSQAVRRHVDRFVPTCRRSLSAALRVPPQAPRRDLVGIAFDYAIRVELVHRATTAEAGRWVAEAAVARLAGRQRTAAHRVVRDARAAFRKLPSDDIERHHVIAAHAAKLAQLDAVVRAGARPTFGQRDGTAEAPVAPEVVAMLGIADQLIALATPGQLVLNPSFGLASAAVGGADADLIAGDTIIEIKTTAKPTVEREYLRQLVGYVALAAASGTQPIAWLGVYFARHGILHRVRLRADVPPSRYAQLAHWLASKHVENQEMRKRLRNPR